MASRIKETKPQRRRISTMIDEPAFWVKIPRREVLMEFISAAVIALVLTYIIVWAWGASGLLNWLLIRYE